MKTVYKKYLHTCIGACILVSFVLNFTIEALARQTFGGGLEYLLHQPEVFLYNMLIIFTTLSVSLLFRRRMFLFVVISALWLTLGIINGVILSNRMTPFTTKDLAVLEDGLSIVTNYLSNLQIGLAVTGFVVLVVLLVLLFLFAPKKKTKINYKKNTAVFLAILIGMFGVTNLAIKTHVVDTFFGNLAYAYRDFGVPYCFINTWLNTGIGQPADYSEDSVLGIFDEGDLGDEGIASGVFEDDGGDHPNIIMLQLESFIDPLLIDGYAYSQDPMPYFRELMERYSSGYLTVPSVGAGTANTEFEVLSGMSVKFFGPGEYPYKAILKEQTCETIAYDLRSMNFATHAIHNHRGAFYGRNKVYPNMGFETFTSLEYMNYVVKTPKNWAKDAVLTGQILDALNSSGKKDFIYAVSVQGHGKYPMTQVLENPAITVTEAPTEQLRWQYEYYANQIYEMDNFVRNLTDVLADYDEEVVLVMFGDHLPALDMAEEDMVNDSLYKTQYVIWSNFKMKKQDQDLAAYQLSAEVLDQLGIHGGVMSRFHQKHKDNPQYLSQLHTLEYDMLYGKEYIYGGQTPYKTVDMRMGINDIVIDRIINIGSNYYIQGENFTEFSKVSLDGEILKTVYVGPTLLHLNEKVEDEAVPRMKISQVEKNNEILSTTE